MWLARHPKVHLHYIPTHASSLNQVEAWFSILASKSLKGVSFGSVHKLIQHIEDCIASYNDTAKQFIWIKSVVYQKRLKPCFKLQ